MAQQHIPMAVDPQEGPSNAPIVQPPVKRKNVDENGQEVPDSKRNRAVPDKDIKLNAYKLILHWHEFLAHKFGITVKANVDDMADISSICQTMHNKFRQDCNAVGKLKDAIGVGYEFTAAKKVLKFEEINVGMKNLAKLYGFNYTTSESDRKLNGTLSSILVLITCFRSRFAEVRLGNTSITLRKMDGVEYEMELSRFGLTNVHSMLLTGCRFTPSLQSCMKQSLGPMTVAINLCMNTEKRYQDSWKSAFKQAFKLIPGVDDIANMLAGSKCAHSSILRMLADISLFGVTRTSNKAFIPAAMLVCSQYANVGYKERFNKWTTSCEREITNELLTPQLINIDSSGKGLLHFWNSLGSMEFVMHGDESILKPMIAQQMIFHAVFGSHKENLELLQWMTGVHFLTRREIGEVFRGRATSGKNVAFNIIPFAKFTKLVSAAQTTLLRGGVGQIARVPTFSGIMSEDLTQDSELFKILSSQETVMYSNTQVTEANILAKLSTVKRTIEQQLKQSGKLEYGTTQFYIPIPGGNGTTRGDEVAGPGVLPRRYFYQQE